MNNQILETRKNDVVDESEGIVRALVSPEKALSEYETFQKLKSRLLSKEDYQPIGDKTFIKKSGWRKLALVFNVSDSIVEEKKDTREDGSFVFTFKVRATAPNGRYSEAVGSCDSSERKFSKLEHDVRATAHTRAKSRAISDLIGAGEVSAEELEDEDRPTSQTKTDEPRNITPRENTIPIDPPVLETEKPFGSFFVNKVLAGVKSKNPGFDYSFEKNETGQITGLALTNASEDIEKELKTSLDWTIKKALENRGKK